MTIVWAVLQFALPTLASYADALVERDSRAQVAHVEGSSDASCRPVHSAECAFCQVLSRDALHAPVAPAPAIVGEVLCPVSTQRLTVANGAVGARPPARAPPAA